MDFKLFSAMAGISMPKSKDVPSQGIVRSSCWSPGRNDGNGEKLQLGTLKDPTLMNIDTGGKWARFWRGYQGQDRRLGANVNLQSGDTVHCESLMDGATAVFYCVAEAFVTHVSLPARLQYTLQYPAIRCV